MQAPATLHLLPRGGGPGAALTGAEDPRGREGLKREEGALPPLAFGNSPPRYLRQDERAPSSGRDGGAQPAASRFSRASRIAASEGEMKV